MKKSIKMMVVLALALIMGFVSQEDVFAANKATGAITYSWQIMKMPGSTNVTTKVYLPYWENDIIYELDSLTGTCTYVVARCEADPVDDAYYTINNSLSGFEHTKPANETFRIKYTTWGILNKREVTLVMSIKHYSSNLINETLTSTGTVSIED